jgi:hypothetical protein
MSQWGVRRQPKCRASDTDSDQPHRALRIHSKIHRKKCQPTTPRRSLRGDVEKGPGQASTRKTGSRGTSQRAETQSGAAVPGPALI